MQASFEAAQLPPIHQTKPGMKVLKVLPGQQLHACQEKQHSLNVQAMDITFAAMCEAHEAIAVEGIMPIMHRTARNDCLAKNWFCPDAQHLS